MTSGICWGGSPLSECQGVGGRSSSKGWCRRRQGQRRALEGRLTRRGVEKSEEGGGGGMGTQGWGEATGDGALGGSGVAPGEGGAYSAWGGRGCGRGGELTPALR